MMVWKKKPDFYEYVFEAVTQLGSETDPQRLLRLIVELVARAIGAKACSLMLLTPDRSVLLHTVAVGLSEWYLRKGPVNVSPAIAEVLAGHPVAVLDAATDERVLYREQAKQEGIASMLSVPMKLRGEIIGVLRVYTARPHSFAEKEIEFIVTLGNLAAIAMERVRVYDSIEQDYQRLLEDMQQLSAEIDDDALAGDIVLPVEDEAIKIPPGG